MIDDNDGDMGSDNDDNETKKPSRNQSKKIKEKTHNWKKLFLPQLEVMS